MNSIIHRNLDLQQIQSEEIKFNTMLKRSEMLAKSSIIPSSLRGKAADVLVIMMMADELDIPPLQALNGINVIQGKPVVSPQLMIALIKSKFPNSYIHIEEKQDECSCTMGRSKDAKDEYYTSKWDWQRAEEMGLTNKDNWKKQGGTMLKWRAVGDAARTVFPDVLIGMYFPDEFQKGHLDINEHGELQGNVIEQKENTVKTIALPQQTPPKPQDEISPQIFKILKEATNYDKEKMSELFADLDIKFENPREILTMSDENKSKILAYLVMKTQ